MERYLPRPGLEKTSMELLRAGEKLVVLSGPRGSGKTRLLRELHRRLARGSSSILIEVEPITASPEILQERFLAIGKGHFGLGANGEAPFDRLLHALSHRGSELTLLLDDVTELRTLSYFPGVHRPLACFLEALVRQRNPRALVTTRFPRWLTADLDTLSPSLRARVEHLEVPPLDASELAATSLPEPRAIVSATGGLPLHVAPLWSRIDAGETLGSALENELRAGGRIEAECRATLAELLQRARGYGACKAVLSLLRDEEGLKLTEIARRMGRTPGATRDYLRWLEEVELVRAREKRFYLVDPLLRLWLRLYARGEPPSERDVREEVARHLNRAGAAPQTAARPERNVAPPPAKEEDLIEID